MDLFAIEIPQLLLPSIKILFFLIFLIIFPLGLGSPHSHLFYEIIFPLGLGPNLISSCLEISLHPRIAIGCQYLTREIPSKIFEEENLINKLLELFFATIPEGRTPGMAFNQQENKEAATRGGNVGYSWIDIPIEFLS